MFEVNAQRYLRTVRSLEGISFLIRQMTLERQININLSAPQDLRNVLAQSIREYSDDCNEIGARASRDHASRIADLIEGSDLPWREIDTLVQVASSTFFDEMEQYHTLFLDEMEARMYENAENLVFGESVVVAFPSGSFDMSEACKCYALGRGTACVFHLMRILELTCKAVWLSVKAMPTNPNLRGWGDYKREIDFYLKNDKREPRPIAWKSRESFYRDVHVHLSAVYTAWRNPTMHLEKTYTLAHAKEILDAVTGLTKSIAAHIDESGNYA